jgi:hypothetical protein
MGPCDVAVDSPELMFQQVYFTPRYREDPEPVAGLSRLVSQ